MYIYIYIYSCRQKKFLFHLRSTQDNDNTNAIKTQAIWSASKTLLQANLKIICKFRYPC